MDKQLTSNLTSSSHWIRLLYMILFAIVLQVAATVMWVVVVLQFFYVLCSGEGNPKLSELGNGLAIYIYQCWQFLNFNSDDKPYPFQDWPEQS